MKTRVFPCNFCGMNLEVPDYIALQEKINKLEQALEYYADGENDGGLLAKNILEVRDEV